MVTTIRFKTLALLGLCLALTLGACGRKGSLDTPGQPSVEETGAADPALAVQPEQPGPPESDRSFFLDFLIK